jgi:hypothetical protein
MEGEIMTVYSVNVMDMTKDDILSTFMIAPVIRSRQTIEVEKGRIDGYAVVLDCPEERAKAIIEVIRMKYGKNEFRCYAGKKRV